MSATAETGRSLSNESTGGPPLETVLRHFNVAGSNVCCRSPRPPEFDPEATCAAAHSLPRSSRSPVSALPTGGGPTVESMYRQEALHAMEAQRTAREHGPPPPGAMVQAIAQPQRAPDGPLVHHERHCLERSTLYRLVQQYPVSVVAHTNIQRPSLAPRRRAAAVHQGRVRRLPRMQRPRLRPPRASVR